MKPSSDQLFLALDETILRSAAWLVPARQRIEWHREWLAELWHVRRSCCTAGSFSWPAQRGIITFCLGSFPDALCMLRQSWMAGSPPALIPSVPRPRLDGSAAQYLLCLSAVLAVCVMLARLLPGVHAEADSSRYQVSPGLIIIQAAQPGDNLVPSISPDLFRNWKAAHQRYFDQFAFYRIAPETASMSPTHAARWRVTHASLNLFSLLGLQIRFASAPSEDDRRVPSVILSDETWTRDFGADPHIVGSLILFGHRTAKIAGVLSYGSWRLPGRPDAWILEPDAQLASDAPEGGLGYVLAHLTLQGESEMLGDRVPITSHAADDLELCGVSFANRLQSPWGIYRFALILALLALPAVTSVTMGESNYSAHRPSRNRTLIRWSFLAAKFALIASIAYFASLDLSYWHATTYSPLAEFFQLVWCFTICLFGFRWALSDQRQRCPVCLRRVTHPAQVGLASRTFLGWNGTEMMCMGGHTLLHVPSLPTSWFSGQRWLYLDTSWEFLFADSGLL